MKITSNKLKGNVVELTVIMDEKVFQPYLKEAVIKLSKEVKIDGFRPGKAPFEIVKKKVGEMALYEKAAGIAISKTCFQAIDKEGLKSVGQPEVDISKIAPGNDFEYKIKVSLFPNVKLADWKKHKIKKVKAEVSKEQVEKVIENYKKMRATEKLVDRAACNGDKVEINFEILSDKVVIEHGSGKKYPFVLGEGSMLPEFDKNLSGMKAGEKKEFKITFPKEYFEKNLQGRVCDAKVELSAVYERILPELNDDYVKGLGEFKTVDDFKKQIKENLLTEEKKKINHKTEAEMFAYLIKNSVFDDIPDVLLTAEIRKMKAEMKENLSSQGMNYDDYLIKIGKKDEEMSLDMSPNARDRVKSSLIIYKYADENKIKVTPEEMDAEMEKMKLIYKDKKDILKMLESPEHKSYLQNSLLSQKVINLLSEQIIQG